MSQPDPFPLEGTTIVEEHPHLTFELTSLVAALTS
jgi:hypothetical protein